MIAAFEYVANILKQAFKWFPWQPPFFRDRRVLLTILPDSDQPCNIKGTCFQHCQAMRSSSLSDSPGAQREARCLSGFFPDVQGHTSCWWAGGGIPRGGGAGRAHIGCVIQQPRGTGGLFLNHLPFTPHCKTMLVTCGSPLKERASTARSFTACILFFFLYLNCPRHSIIYLSTPYSVFLINRNIKPLMMENPGGIISVKKYISCSPWKLSSYVFILIRTGFLICYGQLGFKAALAELSRASSRKQMLLRGICSTVILMEGTCLVFVISPVGASPDAPAVPASLGADLENRAGEVR